MCVSLQALLSRPGVSIHYSNDVIPVASGGNISRILVWQRPIFVDDDEDLPKLKALIEAGYLVVIDWDDDPGYWPNVDQIEATFRSVHAIQVSTPELARRFDLSILRSVLDALPSLPPLPEALLAIGVCACSLAHSIVSRIGLH